MPSVDQVKLNQGDTTYFRHSLESMSTADNYHRWILSEFRPFMGQHLLEVGAGSGHFSKLLLETQPRSFVAVEPSQPMFSLLERDLKDRSGVRCFNAFFGEVRASLPQPPDTIFYINVLEHIGADQSELGYAYETLGAGGHICIFVPALQWMYCAADAGFGHARRYYKRALTSRVEAAGFSVLKCRYFDAAGIVPWYVWFCVFRRQCVHPQQVSAYDRLVVPIMRRIEALAAPPVGKNILLVGKKVSG